MKCMVTCTDFFFYLECEEMREKNVTPTLSPQKNLTGKDLLKIDTVGSLLNQPSGLTSQVYSVANDLNV